MIEYVNRHSLLAEMINQLQALRPQVDWSWIPLPEASSQLFNICKVDKEIDRFCAGVVACGSCITLAISPFLKEGWSSQDIQINFDTSVEFHVPDLEKAIFDSYFYNNYDSKRFFNDGDKYSLNNNPIVFSDSPDLHITLLRTRYSVVEFYRDNFAKLVLERNRLLDELINHSRVSFPSSLCLHSVVVTNDHKLLVSRRSPKVGHYPKKWSISLEEQIKAPDLFPVTGNAVSRLAIRMLKEELGIDESAISSNGVRVLSVFVETDILNCSLMSVIYLNLSSSILDKFIRNSSRSDYEFDSWKFQSHEQVINDLNERLEDYHPSAGYRMLMYSKHLQEK